MNPEELLIAKQEPPVHEKRSRPRRLDLSGLLAPDALALQWWLLGLSMRELAEWLGVAKSRVHQRISRGILTVRERAREGRPPMGRVKSGARLRANLPL
jgi:hypothetical protein